MKLAQYPGFRDDCARYALRFTCEDCALFDPCAERCSHGFPTDEHRLRHYARRDAPLVFCKDFELV
jgi:hypothetical protein